MACFLGCGGGIIAGKGKKTDPRTSSFRSAEIQEIGRSLANLGLDRINKGEDLNVRRTEDLRRALQGAGPPLGWSEVAALSDDPVGAAAKDVKKMVRSGVRSLDRTLTVQLKEQKAEGGVLEKVVESLRELAEEPDVEYPATFTFSRTARRAEEGYVAKVETLTLSDPDEALQAARRIEKSLPKWAKLRDEVMGDLKRKQDTLVNLQADLSTLVESWHGLLKEVLVTMP